MEILIEELSGGLPDWPEFTRFVIRLIAAMLLGAFVGYERERAGKAAGLRTHMLVAMGSALFVIGCTAAEMSMEGLSRVIQGIVTGLGFIGAGAILKHRDEPDTEGLTTAAGIYMTAAIGVAAGLGRLGLALVGAILTWIVLGILGLISARIKKDNASSPGDAK